MIDERSVGDRRVGAALAPVWLVPVEDPIGVIRAKTGVVAIAGSGDGVVDAAAAGLIDGTELIIYTASGASDVPLHSLIVTDSNRDQARQWRGSQDTRGFTEPGGEEPGVATFDSADQRLDVFDEDRAEAQTVAIQTGPVTALASAYGEVFAYRPEDRAAMAIDGDATTAWRVADRFDATGQFIELTAEEPIDSIDVVQPIDGSTGAAPNRWITAIDVSVDGGSPVRVDLDDTSRSSTGQTIRLPTSGHDGSADDRDDRRDTRVRRRPRRHRPRCGRLRRDPHRARAHDRGHPAAHRLAGDGHQQRVRRHADRSGLHPPAGRPGQSLAA